MRARVRARRPAGPGFSESIPTLVHVNIRPSPHAGPLFGSGRHPAGRLGRLCMLICPGLPCILQNWAHTHTQTNKTLSIFPPALAPTRPGLPCVYTHTSLDLTALDPYGDQNSCLASNDRALHMRTLKKDQHLTRESKRHSSICIGTIKQETLVDNHY